MDDLTLIIGSRNYSTWSLRAYLAVELTGLPYETILIHFDEDASRERRLAHSPAGKVPVLKHGELVIWDSLAIGEYLAELAPDAQLWPADRSARARARVVVAEMHSGFPDLRNELVMNIRRRFGRVEPSPGTARDIARIVAIWNDARAAHREEGAFLFGSPSLADAFYAPVVTRFVTYGVPLEGAAADYAQTLLDWAPMSAWIGASVDEGHPLAAYDGPRA